MDHYGLLIAMTECQHPIEWKQQHYYSRWIKKLGYFNFSNTFPEETSRWIMSARYTLLNILYASKLPIYF
uniref:Uncharacterized protein n=1 Tax=Solanum lycopersicum TaxID=4081 RepID=A0A3Q7IKE5_SOLLC